MFRDIPRGYKSVPRRSETAKNVLQDEESQRGEYSIGVEVDGLCDEERRGDNDGEQRRWWLVEESKKLCRAHAGTALAGPIELVPIGFVRLGYFRISRVRFGACRRSALPRSVLTGWIVNMYRTEFRLLVLASKPEVADSASNRARKVKSSRAE